MHQDEPARTETVARPRGGLPQLSPGSVRAGTLSLVAGVVSVERVRPALVVGGTSGIGAALVARYRDQGIPVVTWDIKDDPDVVCDISESDRVTEAVEETLDRFGLPGDVTVTAGIGHAGYLRTITTDEWDRVLSVNTKGPLLVMRALADAMVARAEGGSIVATSSISGRVADRGMGAYCASKAALDMVVRVAAVEWAPHGIRVNAVSPGVTRTPMLGKAPVDAGWLASVGRRTALGRLGMPADIAEAIGALHAMTWVTGEILTCDGGLSLHSPIDSFGDQVSTRREGDRDG